MHALVPNKNSETAPTSHFFFKLTKDSTRCAVSSPKMREATIYSV